MTAAKKYFSHEITLSLLSSPAGLVFPATIAYCTYGSPSLPAVLFPTCYGGHLDDTTPFLYQTEDGLEPPVSPNKYFVIVCGLLGGSESSSPSNTSAPHNGKHFPQMSYEDNIRLQYALCQHLGVTRLFGYIGFSMGGQQAYHMAVLYPDFVERIVCIAGSARTSWHNYCFLEGPKAALINSIDFEDGDYTKPAKRGTKAFGRVYSAWALSPEWFRQKCWESLGFGTLDDYLDENWTMGTWDAHDLLQLLQTWQKGDITVYHAEDKGDLPKALSRIHAKCLIMPSATDTYFPPEDNEEECKYLKNAVFVKIPSIWGHLAGGGDGTAQDNRFIQDQVRIFFENTL